MTSNLNGWLFIDKPVGISSFKAVSLVKKILPRKHKVGHGGTLDVLAEGVLPIAIGSATKTVDIIMQVPKEYVFEMQFGVATTTADAEGECIEASENFPSLDDLRASLQKFQGVINQTPPMYSAIKINGKRAYELARKGEHIEIKSRKVHIYEIELLDYNHEDKRAKIRAIVSKGTYIRSLAVDIAKNLNSVAHVIFLRRTKYLINKQIVLISINKVYNKAHESILENLVPIEYLLDDISAYYLDEYEALKLTHGNLQGLDFSDFQEGIIRALYKEKIIALLRKNYEEIKIIKVFSCNLNS